MYNEVKAVMTERWNHTMKGRMWRYFTAKNTNIYYDVLQKLVSDYNNNKHSTIKMSPVHASMARNEKDAWSNLHNRKKRQRNRNSRLAIKSVYLSTRERYSTRDTRQIGPTKSLLSTKYNIQT